MPVNMQKKLYKSRFGYNKNLWVRKRYKGFSNGHMSYKGGDVKVFPAY